VNRRVLRLHPLGPLHIRASPVRRVNLAQTMVIEKAAIADGSGWRRGSKVEGRVAPALLPPPHPPPHLTSWERVLPASSRSPIRTPGEFHTHTASPVAVSTPSTPPHAHLNLAFSPRSSRSPGVLATPSPHAITPRGVSFLRTSTSRSAVHALVAGAVAHHDASAIRTRRRVLLIEKSLPRARVLTIFQDRRESQPRLASRSRPRLAAILAQDADFA